MAGTFATFAGIPCLDVHFVRSRGWGADPSYVDVPADAVPRLEAPASGAMAARRLPGSVNLAGIRGGAALGPAPLLSGRVPFEGALVMAESVNGGPGEESVTVPNLIVAAVEAVRTPESGAKRVRLSLVDERWFHVRGVLARWSYNRLRANGDVAADSLKPDGSPWNRREVVEDAARCLFRKPKVATAPADWERDRGAIEFQPFGSAVSALAEVVSKDGLEEPAFRLDGELALYRPGEGKVGYAPGGRGANVRDFPPEVRLYKGGSGQGAVVENTYPEEWLIVVGGERIASVAIDSWEPVLVLDAHQVVPLNEATINKLTGGRGMEWLHRFVLQPLEVQSVAGVPDEVLELLRDQAYRLFRMPGVVAEDGVSPGPNAHLVPMLDRAETINGRRLPVRVETFRYTTVHQQLLGSAAAADLGAARDALALVRQLIAEESIKRGAGHDPFSTPEYIAFNGVLTRRDIFGEIPRNVDQETLQRSLDEARLIRRVGELVGQGLAEQYRNALRTQHEAEDRLGGTTKYSTLFQLGLEGDAFERQARALNEGTVSTTQTAQERLEALAAKLRAPMQERLRQVSLAAEREREASAVRQRLGGFNAPDDIGMTVLKNLPRTEDAGSSVPYRELGIVRTGELAGHVRVDPASGVEQPVPTNPSHAALVPCPVRVTFGAVVRPKLTRTVTTVLAAADPTVTRTRDSETNAQRVRPRPGPGADCEPQPDVIPEALSDQETYYVAAFRRTGPGAVSVVPLESVPLDQAVPLRAPDLAELVELGGSSNRVHLDREAFERAAARSRIVDQVATSRMTLGRPWPVQCDGLVAKVEIRMRFKDGAPCGFETTLTVGSALAPLAGAGGGTREDPARRGAAALRAQNAAQREGVRP